VKILRITGAVATLELERAELITINNALNEVCHGIDLKEEFETRIGTTVEEAERLLKDINSLV
jgi:hypothetical protein